MEILHTIATQSLCSLEGLFIADRFADPDDLLPANLLSSLILLVLMFTPRPNKENGKPTCFPIVNIENTNHGLAEKKTREIRACYCK